MSATRISFLEGETQGVETGRGFLPHAPWGPPGSPGRPRDKAPRGHRQTWACGLHTQHQPAPSSHVTPGVRTSLTRVVHGQCFRAELQASRQHTVLQPALRGPRLTPLPRGLLQPSPGAYVLRIPGGRALGWGGGVLVPAPQGLASPVPLPGLPSHTQVGLPGPLSVRPGWCPGQVRCP